MINIEFTDKKPEYYGFTGIHLYEVKSKDIEGERKIVIDAKANAFDLYKLYNDLAIFLSNQVDPDPREDNLNLYPVFGNPRHLKSIRNSTNDEYQLVGFLDVNDVRRVSDFLNLNGLDDKENVQKY